jgi:hypothetical protein
MSAAQQGIDCEVRPDGQAGRALQARNEGSSSKLSVTCRAIGCACHSFRRATALGRRYRSTTDEGRQYVAATPARRWTQAGNPSRDTAQRSAVTGADDTRKPQLEPSSPWLALLGRHCPSGCAVVDAGTGRVLLQVIPLPNPNIPNPTANTSHPRPNADSKSSNRGVGG